MCVTWLHLHQVLKHEKLNYVFFFKYLNVIKFTQRGVTAKKQKQKLTKEITIMKFMVLISSWAWKREKKWLEKDLDLLGL